MIIEENELMHLRMYKDKIKALLVEFEEFFTEIAVTGLVSFVNKSGFNNIKKMVQRFDKLGLISTSARLQTLLENLKDLENDGGTKIKATFLLNRLITWFTIFSAQFSYMTAETGTISEDDVLEMVETGQMKETIDVELIPFAVKKGTGKKISIYCTSVSMNDYFIIQDAIQSTHANVTQHNSEFFGRIPISYRAFLKNKILITNVVLEKEKTISGTKLKGKVLRRVIHTRFKHLPFTDWETLGKKLIESGILSRVETSNVKFTGGKIIVDKGRPIIGTNLPEIWRNFEIFHLLQPSIFYTSNKSDSIGCIMMEDENKMYFPALGEWPRVPRTNILSAIMSDSNLLQNIDLLEKLIGGVEDASGNKEEIAADIESMIFRDDADWRMVFLRLMLLVENTGGVPEEMEEKILERTREILESKKKWTRRYWENYIYMVLCMYELNFERKEKLTIEPILTKLGSTTLKRASDTYPRIVKIIAAKLNGVTFGKLDELVSTTQTLINEIMVDSNEDAIANRIQHLAPALQILRHKVDVFTQFIKLGTQDIIDAFCYYYCMYKQMEGEGDPESTGGKSEMKRPTSSYFLECIYILSRLESYKNFPIMYY
ncbi:MAG: hypothetical protein ACTSUE_09300 [Promethearchaeota archaeon]